MISGDLHKTVYVNARFLAQPVTGVQRFAIELCRELKTQRPDVQFLAPPDALHSELAAAFQCRIIGRRTGHAWEQITLPSFLKKEGSPVLINLCNTAPLNYSRNIVTVHDLAFLQHPEWFTPLFRRFYRFLVPRILKKALAICTVSESIKQEIITVLRLPEDKIHVTYNGLPGIFFKQRNHQEKTFDRPYFLAFGSRNARKNTQRVAEAMQLLEHDNYDLRIVSRAEGNFKKNRDNSHPYSFRMIRHSDASDADLQQLYSGATALVYPSLYEGFGLPPLEAIHCGCPVILSKIPVFEELYEGFAIFVDPFDSKAIKDGMKKAISKEHPSFSAEDLDVLKGKYSYQSSAKVLLALVRNIETGNHGA